MICKLVDVRTFRPVEYVQAAAGMRQAHAGIRQPPEYGRLPEYDEKFRQSGLICIIKRFIEGMTVKKVS